MKKLRSLYILSGAILLVLLAFSAPRHAEAQSMDGYSFDTSLIFFQKGGAAALTSGQAVTGDGLVLRIAPKTPISSNDVNFVPGPCTLNKQSVNAFTYTDETNGNVTMYFSPYNSIQASDPSANAGQIPVNCSFSFVSLNNGARSKTYTVTSFTVPNSISVKTSTAVPTATPAPVSMDNYSFNYSLSLIAAGSSQEENAGAAAPGDTLLIRIIPTTPIRAADVDIDTDLPGCTLNGVEIDPFPTTQLGDDTADATVEYYSIDHVIGADEDSAAAGQIAFECSMRFISKSTGAKSKLYNATGFTDGNAISIENDSPSGTVTSTPTQTPVTTPPTQMNGSTNPTGAPVQMNGSTNPTGAPIQMNGTNVPLSTFYLQNPLSSQFNSVGGLVQGFLQIFSYVVVLFAVLMLIWVGLKFILAQGKPEELNKLKSWLLWIVVGVAIVIGARIIVSVVINTLQATNAVSPNVIQNANNALNGHP